MDVVYERCCGLDVHKKSVVACLVVPGPNGKPIKETRTFGTMTEDLVAVGMVQTSLTVRQLRGHRHLRRGRHGCRMEVMRCGWVAQRDQPIARCLQHAAQL